MTSHEITIAIINGVTILIVFALGTYFYLRQEKKKFLEEKKIETYSETIIALKRVIYSFEGETYSEMQKINLISLKVLFYGTNDIYNKIGKLLKPLDATKSRITGKDVDNLIEDMLKEINKKRNTSEIEFFIIEDI